VGLLQKEHQQGRQRLCQRAAKEVAIEAVGEMVGESRSTRSLTRIPARRTLVFGFTKRRVQWSLSLTNNSGVLCERLDQPAIKALTTVQLVQS
jgi:hypothetical protein